MDKQTHPIDELFRQKLQQHVEKPSGLAWEKLDSQLGQKKSSGKGIWLRIAAVLITVFALAYLLWQNNAPKETRESPLLTEKTIQPIISPQTPNNPSEVLADKPENSSRTPAIEKQQKENTTKTRNETAISKPIDRPKKDNKPLPAKENLESKEDLSPLKTKLVVPELEVPELNMSELVAKAPDLTEKDKTPTPVAYKVSIKSSGISEKPKKETLVEEIGNKLNSLDGLLGKVDQGYAELQDAKNNLFASLIAKKENE